MQQKAMQQAISAIRTMSSNMANILRNDKFLGIFWEFLQIEYSFTIIITVYSQYLCELESLN